MRRTQRVQVLAAVVFACGVSACSDSATPDDEPMPEPTEWQVVHERLGPALLSVWGSAADDVWAVGATGTDGSGPLVIHFDGEEWERLETGQEQGTLWWVFGFDGGPVYMGGDGGVILRYEDDEFSVLETPGTDTVFGIWGASEDDVWAVGGASESGGGFAWRLDGESFQPEPSVPEEVTASAALWKVYGSSSDEAWLVGSNGVSLHWDGSSLTAGDTGVGSSLFTVHTVKQRYAAVGGLVTGIIVEYDDDAWRNVTPDPPPQPLSGVWLSEQGGYAVGGLGSIYERGSDGWSEVDTGFFINENFHAVWIDDDAGVWAVGGQTFSEPFTDGVLVHFGRELPSGGL